MANPEHLAILNKGILAWNKWRDQNRDVLPDLSSAELSDMNFCEDSAPNAPTPIRANFQEVNLFRAKLYNSTAFGANFSFADLREANLCDSLLNSVVLAGANCEGTHLQGADLRNSLLLGVNFARADFWHANLTGALLSDADFHEASLGGTVFGDNDLSQVKGLITVRQRDLPCVIGVETIYASRGNIPRDFLTKCGVPHGLIDFIPSLVAAEQDTLRLHSCFISYSTNDEEFARRLHSRMRGVNIRVWFAPENLKGGRKLHEQIFEAIQIHDRLLIVLSEHSIQSEWVMTEIRKAREQEKRENRRKLFPIRLTDIRTLKEWTCFDADTGKDFAVEVREYFIPDFSNWKNHDAFESAFARLKKDLEAENLKR
jgi:hypothetical protein